jgi:uncharacterized membrane protein YkoI
MILSSPRPKERTMQRRNKILLATAGLGTLVATGTGVAVASGADGTDTPITGASLDTASAAALAETGAGRVTGTEINDEESYYEVEVTLDDGSQIDVQLDESFTVVGSKHDGGDPASDG